MIDSHSQAKVWVGFITYGNLTSSYLPYFLQSLRQQTYTDTRLVCFDNTPEERNENSEYLKQFPDIKIYHQNSNKGFSVAYNVLLQAAIEAGADYFLIINPDTILDPDVIEQLVKELENYPTCGSVAPKLRKWNFQARTRTSVLDTCGLTMKPGLRFIDVGQGEEDRGQYNHQSIIGPSGAAGLFRLSALEKVAVNNHYFDEAFFMYKEDCDLIYRLQLAGFKSRLVSQAVVYHDRTASGGSFWKRAHNRFGRSKAANRYAFINQHFLYIKYWNLQKPKERLRIVLDSLSRGLHGLIFEPYLLSCYSTIFKARAFLKKY